MKKAVLILFVIAISNCTTSKKPVYEVDYNTLHCYDGKLQGWIDGYRQALIDTQCPKPTDKLQEAYSNYCDSISKEFNSKMFRERR